MNAQAAAAEFQYAYRQLARSADGGTLDVTGPIRAGMRARAVADACTRLDLAAILIDRTGRVLHIDESAKSALERGRLRVEAGHLIGPTREANARITQAVGLALGEGSEDSQPCDSEDGEMPIAGLMFHDESSFQLLRGILVLDASQAAITTLRGALAA